MSEITRRRILRLFGMAAPLLAGLSALPAAAADEGPVRIGYAISQTGPNSGGAGITTLPNYQLWVKEVNDAGGLELLDGSSGVPIEVIEYDDRSSPRRWCARSSGWRTRTRSTSSCRRGAPASTSRSAPLFDRFGYPQLAVTAVTDKAPELVQRWKKSYWLLGGGHDYTDALADLLAKAARARARSTSRWR